ncbi:MAG TPA: hypothetical protein VN541_24670 [Tepidisphaeraceae bacterium]|nr:hypothetical protein [Tepidisphaeraceae bacterium]
MLGAINITIRQIMGDELAAYDPGERFRTLREFWRPTNSAIDDSSAARLLVIRVTFTNTAPGDVELPLDNSGNKAELLSLRIVEPTGHLLMPHRNIDIRLKHRPVKEPRLIPAGGSFSMDLIGELVDEWLIFPGAKYQLAPPGAYRMFFEYENVRSNELVLEVV